MERPSIMKLKKTSLTRRLFPLFALSFFVLPGCGKSIYSPAAQKQTDEALKEEAVIALNSSDYDKAEKPLEKLWKEQKTNELAQLYAVTLLGKAGFDLFDVVKKALLSISDSSEKQSAAGNAILDRISNVVGSELTQVQFDYLKQAIDVLLAAPDQKNAGVAFQKCLTAGIYAAPTLANLASQVTEIKATLQALPSRVQASGSSCGASTATINAIGEDLTALITSTATMASRIKDIESIMGECLPKGSAAGVNEITSKVAKLSTQADKGCTIPSNQTIGAYTLPSCMNTFVLASGGSSAQASDGTIAGCEVFIHCSSPNSCF
jgi:hypothetical protein